MRNFRNTHSLSDDESTLITNFQKLSAVDKQEILNIIEYKIYKSEEKEKLSHTNKNLRNNRLA